MRKIVIALILLATGIFCFVTRTLSISQSETTNFGWGHFGIIAVPIVCLFIAYSEDYNQRTMNMFWAGIICSVLAIPIATLAVKLFYLPGNKIAWTLAEGLSYLIVAAIVLIDRKVEISHRRQFGLGEYKTHEPV